MSNENSNSIACPSCGFRSRAGAKFCGGCGERIQVSATCSACGADNEATNLFCVACGVRFGSASATTAATAAGLGTDAPAATAAEVGADATPAPSSAAAVASGGERQPLFARWRGLSFRAKAISLLAVVAVVVVAAFVLFREGTDDSAQSLAPGGNFAIANPLSSGSGEVRLEPDPSTLTIRSDPTEHHSITMVAERSALVTAEYPGAPVIVVHNNPDLLQRDACAEVKLAPEGYYALLLIKPEDISGEWRPSFFLVGCAPGTGVLSVEGEGVTPMRYTVDVVAP